MPLDASGNVYNSLSSNDPYMVVSAKCAEMRRELRRLEQLVARIEGQARIKAPLDAIRPNLSTMFWWYVSALESFFAITQYTTGADKTRQVIADFTRRFTNFTRSPVVYRKP